MSDVELEDVVGWLQRAGAVQMEELRGRLSDDLAADLFGASARDTLLALQEAAGWLRRTTATGEDKVLLHQFALEVDDIVARLGALLARRTQRAR